MQVQRIWRVLPAVAIALTGLVSGSSAARAADLTRYISPDFCAAVVIHPERISESTLAEAIKSALPKELAGGDPAAAAKAAAAQNKNNLPTGMDVEKLTKLLQGAKYHRVVVFVDSTIAGNVPATAAIVQFSADIDGQGIIAAYTTDQEPAEVGGVKYSKIKGKAGVPDVAAVAPDSRTLIFGVESTVVKMLGSNEGERPLLKQLQKATLNHDILIEVCAEPLWAGLAKSGQTQDKLLAGLGNPAMVNAAKDVKSFSLQLDYSGDSLLHAEVASGKPETAAMLSMIGQQMAGSAKQQFEALKKNPPPFAPPALVPVISKLGDEALGGLKIKADGTLATLDLAMPESLPEALKAVVKTFAGMIPQPAAGK